MAKRKSIDFEAMIKDGSKAGVPGGFVTQTPNGTATWRGAGWNEVFDWQQPEVPEGGPWQGRRSTRTGE